VMKHNQVCIYLDDSSNNTIEENILTDSEFGIQLEDSSSNYIWCNNVTNNTKGIDLTSSTKNVIQQNDIRRNNHGIRLTVSTCNIISGNHLTENIQGICLERRLTIMDYDDPYNSTVIYACSNNTVSKNNINENNCGVWMSSASNNTFSGNNFINNTDQIKMEDFTSFLVASGIEPTSSRFASINFWDDGKEGNYWSSYTGNDSDGDGIGEPPYIIDENNPDNYPLLNPIIIPEFTDDEKPAMLNPTLITITVVIALAIIFGMAFNRRKKMSPTTPIQ
jgi:parallel beta-helix repeat protein